MNLSALGAGLLCHKLHTDDGTGCGFHFLDRAAELHSAPLTPAAGMNLGFDYLNAGGQVLGDTTCFLGREGGSAVRHLYAKFSEDCFTLVLMDIHTFSSLIHLVLTEKINKKCVVFFLFRNIC